MRSRSSWLVLSALTATLAFGCARTDTPTAATGDQKPSASAAAEASSPGKNHFGAAITEATPTALADIVREPGKFAAKTVRTEGNVKAVCQEMGCWMEIEDPTGLAHVKMAGHAFSVPRDASGRRAVIQGTVLAPAEGHDGCAEEAREATGQVAKVQIEATGVELLD
ncbi:MAG: DUF4920 domain-containing protein [Polyangiaceae bacterium]|nr:DUF4920 domain-containing protein [Polyangiaceae bacterium]